jgi:hypothetical protein
MTRSVRHTIPLPWLAIVPQLIYFIYYFTGDQLQGDLTTWLSPPDPFINYNTASDARYACTGVWFTESTEFKIWKESSSLLWVYGKRTFSKLCALALIKESTCSQRVLVKAS